ncbi:MAG: hypothetical protein GY906_18280 [bacterium]|nr:hypothetical protein [bacterium]
MLRNHKLRSSSVAMAIVITIPIAIDAYGRHSFDGDGDGEVDGHRECLIPSPLSKQTTFERAGPTFIIVIAIVIVIVFLTRPPSYDDDDDDEGCYECPIWRVTPMRSFRARAHYRCRYRTWRRFLILDFQRHRRQR